MIESLLYFRLKTVGSSYAIRKFHSWRKLWILKAVLAIQSLAEYCILQFLTGIVKARRLLPNCKDWFFIAEGEILKIDLHLWQLRQSLSYFCTELQSAKAYNVSWFVKEFHYKKLKFSSIIILLVPFVSFCFRILWK